MNTTTGRVRLTDSKLHPPIHLRGGAILPVSSVKEAVNTRIVQQNSIHLDVFPKNKIAFGELFWDDGDSINTIESGNYNLYEFKLLSNCTIEINVVKLGYSSGIHKLENITIYNTEDAQIKGKIDGISFTDGIESASSVNDNTILSVNINLQSKKESQKFIISWSTSNSSCNLK